jgi:L-alanine-DL-glutamate epimerase-like enolase superfamily enzyme
LSRIAEVEALVLRLPEVDAADLDGSCETLVVRIVDEDGTVGIGEADTPADAARTLVLMDDVHARSRGMRNVLLGRDPFELRALWRALYHETSYHGLRGLAVHALSAVDVALHDLVGKQLGRPVYQLLGGACRVAVVPYATVYAGPVEGRTIGEVMDETLAGLERALALGYRAVKMEVIFEHLVDDRRLAECIEEGRRTVGDDVVLMLSFGFRWTDWRDALRVMRRIDDLGIYLAQAALPHDDLAGHAELTRRVDTRIAGAESVTTLHDALRWIERRAVDVLQPDPNRCGGLSELRRIAEAAELEGLQVVPHAWKTGLTLAACVHAGAAIPNMPYVEAFVPELFPSPLRAGLVRPEPLAALTAGALPLPAAPGLGVELDADVVARYRVA